MVTRVQVSTNQKNLAPFVLYSETQLTFQSDKAIALSGIAKVMRDAFKDEYVAGLW